MNPVIIAAALTFFSIDPYADFPHLPDERPRDAVEATTFAAAATLGEFESVSFLALPETDLKRVDFKFSDMQGPNGAVIPSSAIDLKSVKVWFQPDGLWTSGWAGKPSKPVPSVSMVLHDDALVKVDWEKKANYVRFNYPDGTVYKRMSGADIDEKLKYGLEPIEDADKFVPFDLRGGKFQQYWLTYKVPADAATGLYRGTAAVSSDGKPMTTLKLELEVYPFTLPAARTHYDSSRPYMCAMMNAVNVANFLSESHDLKAAEAKVLATFRMMADHNITHPHGPGIIRKADTDDYAVRTLHLMREAGLVCKPLFAASTMDNSWFRSTKEGDHPVWTSRGDPDGFRLHMENVEAYARRMCAAFDKYLGHHDAYYIGWDEAPAEECIRQYAIWSRLKANGCKVYSAYGDIGTCGWSIDCCNNPATLSHSVARSWHDEGAIVTSYAAPFAGPDCPAIWRRTKGIRFWYADYDGLSDYVFYYHARNRWNEFIRSPDGYRSFGIVYPCRNGMIGTVALEAMREGMDDVRYLSLLKLRAEAAMKHSDPETMLLGKRALAWMESRDPSSTGPLDDFRKEVATWILKLITAVGPQPDEPPGRPLPKLPPHAIDVMAADESIPVAKRASSCASANRYDLAIPLYQRLRTDKSVDLAARVNYTIREAELRMVMLDRRGAVAAIDACLGEKPEREDAGRLRLAKANAMLTPAGFHETFSTEMLRIGERELDAALASADYAGRARFDLVWHLTKAHLNSTAPTNALAYAEKAAKTYNITGANYGTLLYCGVEALDRAGRKREAYELLKKVSRLGGGNLTGDGRTISGSLGFFAESFGEYDKAQVYFSDALQCWPSNNDKWYPLYKQCLIRVTKKAREMNASKLIEEVPGAEANAGGITLDEKF